MNSGICLNDLYVIKIEKHWNTLCDEAVLELPILITKPILVWKSNAVSDYVLTSVQFMNTLYNINIDSVGMWVNLTLEQIEQINKYWDICISKNLDYMNIKFK